MLKSSLLLLITLIATSLHAQSGWRRLNAPTPIRDLDVNGEALIGILTDSAWVSVDGGAHWRSFGAGYSNPDVLVTSIDVLDERSVILYGSSNREENHQLWFAGAVATTNEGASWEGGFGEAFSGFPAHYHILTRTPRTQFLGVHARGDLNYGATQIEDRLRKRKIYSVKPENWTMMCAVDGQDSVYVGFVGWGWPGHQKLVRSLDAGKTWDSLRAFPTGMIARPVIRVISPSTWFMSFDSTLLISHDIGSSWSVRLQTESAIEDMQYLDSIGYIVLRGVDHLLATRDSGKSWMEQSTDGARDLKRVQIVNDSVAYCYGPTSLITKRSVEVKTVSSKRLAEAGVNIYPNPATDVLHISCDQAAHASFAVFAINGDQVYSGILRSGEATISLSRFAAGVYTVRIIADDGSSMVKPFIVR